MSVRRSAGARMTRGLVVTSAIVLTLAMGTGCAPALAALLVAGGAALATAAVVDATSKSAREAEESHLVIVDPAPPAWAPIPTLLPDAGCDAQHAFFLPLPLNHE